VQVNLCFQRVAADILNIKLTKPEVEQQQRVVKAEVIHYKNDIAAAKPMPQETKSSFCSIQ
jgi:Ras-related protein Rab-28